MRHTRKCAAKAQVRPTQPNRPCRSADASGEPMTLTSAQCLSSRLTTQRCLGRIRRRGHSAVTTTRHPTPARRDCPWVFSLRAWPGRSRSGGGRDPAGEPARATDARPKAQPVVFSLPSTPQGKRRAKVSTWGQKETQASPIEPESHRCRREGLPCCTVSLLAVALALAVALTSAPAVAQEVQDAPTSAEPAAPPTELQVAAANAAVGLGG